MQFKLDENLTQKAAQLFREAGHDTSTVKEQGLCSASDHQVINICQNEKRCLVTLDLDFANPLIFDPAKYSGIAVLRLPPRPEFLDLIEIVQTLLQGLVQDSIQGKLWIVQKEKIRQYQPNEISL